MTDQRQLRWDSHAFEQPSSWRQRSHRYDSRQQPGALWSFTPFEVPTPHVHRSRGLSPDTQQLWGVRGELEPYMTRLGGNEGEGGVRPRQPRRSAARRLQLRAPGGSVMERFFDEATREALLLSALDPFEFKRPLRNRERIPAKLLTAQPAIPDQDCLCTICQEEFHPEKEERKESEDTDCKGDEDSEPFAIRVADLKCGHLFHYDCLQSWLATHTTCPNCRADLTPDTIGSKKEEGPQEDPTEPRQGETELAVGEVPFHSTNATQRRPQPAPPIANRRLLFQERPCPHCSQLGHAHFDCPRRSQSVRYC